MIFTYLWLDPDYLCISCFSLSLQQNQALPLTKTMEYCSNGLGTLCCCLIFFLPVRCSPSQKSKTLQFTVPWVAVHTGTCLFVWRSSFCKVLANTEIKTYFLEPYWWGKIHFDRVPKLPLCSYPKPLLFEWYEVKAEENRWGSYPTLFKEELIISASPLQLFHKPPPENSSGVSGHLLFLHSVILFLR